MARAAGVAQTHREAPKEHATDPRGHQKNPEELGGGVLSRNQPSNNTGGNNTFAFAFAATRARPPSSRHRPKRRNPKPRRAMQPKESGEKKQNLRDFPWHSNHLSQRGRSCGWVGIGTFRFAKVASGSRSLVSRHFCIKLENCSPLARSTGLVRQMYGRNFSVGKKPGENVFCNFLKLSARLSVTKHLDYAKARCSEEENTSGR